MWAPVRRAQERGPTVERIGYPPVGPVRRAQEHSGVDAAEPVDQAVEPARHLVEVAR